MNREQFLASLRQLQLALSNDIKKPLLSNFWFDGVNATAFDDIIAIQNTCAAPLKGGIKGKLLMSYLSSRAANEIEFSVKDSVVTIKAGVVGTTEFPLLPLDSFKFEFPKATGTQVAIIKEFIDSLDLARTCMSKDSTQKWQLGITLVGGERAFIYATDNLSAIRVSLGIPIDYDQVIIPPKFVDCLIDISKQNKPLDLIISKDWVQANFESGLKLWSKTLIGAKAETYEDYFSSTAEDDVKDSLMPIPAGLAVALSSADVFIPTAKQPFSEFSLKDDKLTIKTSSSSGNSEDVLLCDKRQDIVVKASPKLVNRLLVKAQKIGFTAGYVLLKGAGFSYIVSTISE